MILLVRSVVLAVSLGQMLVTPDEARPDPARPAVDESALAILRQADEATKAVETVRYKASRYGTGWLATRLSQVDGTAVFRGTFDHHYGVARFDVNVQFPHGGRVHRITYGADGSAYFLIEHDTKTYYEDEDPRVTGHMGRVVQLLGMREFVHPTPFDDELNGQSLVYLGRQRVGDVMCHVVDVVYAKNRGRAIWYFSMEDHLPRRVDRVREHEVHGRGAAVLELAELTIDPPLDEGSFEPEIPEGYVKSADFAFDVADVPR